MIIPNAGPFYFPGGKIGCLLVHGFTGTPREMRWLGEQLNVVGYSVAGIRLAGHATSVKDMMRTRWNDWLTSVEDGYHLLSSSVEQIYIIGLSLGGILSLAFASEKFTPNCPLAGLVVMSSPHHLPANPLLLKTLTPISWIMPHRTKAMDDWFDRQAAANNISYDVDPIRGIAELRDLLAITRSLLETINIPALLIYSKDDKTVTPQEKHAELIFKALPGVQKELVWIAGSGHNVTSDQQRQVVLEYILKFIHQNTQPATWDET